MQGCYLWVLSYMSKRYGLIIWGVIFFFKYHTIQPVAPVYFLQMSNTVLPKVCILVYKWHTHSFEVRSLICGYNRWDVGYGICICLAVNIAKPPQRLASFLRYGHLLISKKLLCQFIHWVQPFVANCFWEIASSHLFGSRKEVIKILKCHTHVTL